ncbi:transmembrane protein 180-like isoform X2 [Cygnus atratus]|uniref:transmembrane protein 180-like isoform X2 n=1 Tax=Cygnus atratus TaxID=8868 RepID=UPI0015D5CC1C|nr:transmembrane protein 180-like isoform X2 [Cygnus atratus]XP_035404741.1 transmembrane protein 180-like isoform X2 [Cygnus atratus]XP_035404742.1 transmembrane protein 180-like isoform X2 [Cygnus atratus]XP_035404743.1 transmembrane protein 180-like isoform X2 [Cygnus atratus]XP_035404744.1 transmembrane protein 180-like isoform X2 [Cygnus atratus]XP_035404745.1 transmembrane protein 180-like isoform X2 [Cygnus atratus]XP_035404746.1 transmembrane protein 180-like isoform X2 [Cygnus atratu
MKFVLGIQPNALAYSMTTLGAGMMNSIFNFYYVKLFLNRYKISEVAFHQAQVVFMIWNAINDPLFGYIQDNSKFACCSRRQFSILYGAPLYALAFLLPWFPWKHYEEGDWLSGLHLIVALCAFDGLLTFVLLAQCALFAEISTRHESRLQLIKYNQVATLIGSTSILFCGLISDNMENFASFQAFAVLVAALATACMCYTGKYSTSQYEQREVLMENADLENGDRVLSWSSVISLTKQIMTEKNFLFFVTMNFFQVFHLAFCNNFMMIFADNLIPKDVLSSSIRSVMYGAGFICPQCLVLLSHASLKKFGYYRIILFSFYFEGVAAAVMFFLGPEHYYLLAFYLTTNMVIVQASFSLFNLPLADIVDADLIKHKRRSPLSSMVFGTNALFTKPAQSLAPMLVVTILNQFGYENLNNEVAQPDPSLFLGLHDVMFYLICMVPLCIAVVQILTWTRFSIQNSHLTAVR